MQLTRNKLRIDGSKASSRVAWAHDLLRCQCVSGRESLRDRSLFLRAVLSPLSNCEWLLKDAPTRFIPHIPLGHTVNRQTTGRKSAKASPSSGLTLDGMNNEGISAGRTTTISAFRDSGKPTEHEEL